MSPAASERSCPKCGATVTAEADRCPSCQAVLPAAEEPIEVQAVTAEPARRKPARRRDDDDDEDDYDDEDDRPRRTYAKDPGADAAQFLVPLNVSGWAIASCYMGLLGMCIPIVGLILTIPALIFGIIALRRQKRAATYGAVTGNVRAILGIVFSVLGILFSAFFAFMMLMAK